MTIPQAWPFAADWTSPISETLGWLTAIQTSPLGAEQRQALRVTPRRTIDMPFMLTGQERAYFDVLMAANGGSPWLVPIPHEAVTLTAIAFGASSFPFDTSYRELEVGSYVLLRDSSFNYELLVVAAVWPTGITTTTASVNSYLSGAVLAPCFQAQITEKVTAARRTARTFTGTVRFSSLQPTVWPVNGRTAGVLAVTRASQTVAYPVLTQEPNGINNLEYLYDRMLKVSDNQMSIPIYVDKASRVFNSQKYEWFLYGRKERQAFRDLLWQLRGRCLPIWVPTFNDDLSPGLGYPDPHSTMLTPPADRELAIQFKSDGTFNIIGVSEYVGIAPPPEQFDSASIYRTSFLQLKRLDVDTIEFMHNGDLDGVATVSAILRDAPDLRVPTTYAALPYALSGFNDEPTVGSTTAATNTAIALTATVTVTVTP